MEETRITFETAKLAKEKKFDLNVSSFFQSNQIIVNEINAAEINSNLYCRSYLPAFKLFHNANSNTEQDWYSRPTQGLLQKWLREVHGLHIEVMVSNQHIPNKGLIYTFIVLKPDLSKNRNCINHVSVSKEPSDSYEEALEIGLQEGLKLIK